MKRNYSLARKTLILAGALLLSGCGDSSLGGKSGTDIKTVTFDMNGASGQNIVVNVQSGSVIASKNVNKEYDGYYFDAWCTDKEGEHPYDFTKTVTDNITLYASWNFHVYFMDEIGEESAIDSEYIVVKKDHTLDEEPECTDASKGKKFAYWARYAADDIERVNPIKFDITEKISVPDLTYYANFESFDRTFNFYIGGSCVKTSVANNENEYVDLPTYSESFGDNEGFKGWYSSETDGERFDFVDFSVVSENYTESTTNVYARYETIIGDKSLADMADSYKYKSYGAKISRGVGVASGTYSISLGKGYTADDNCKYGFALYPTIFKGNLYSKKYTMDLKLGEMTSDNLSIQPRIYILDDNGNRINDGELYTKNGEAKTSGNKSYALYDLVASGGVDFEWNEDHYFQLGFEFKQLNSVADMGSIQIESFGIYNSSVELTSDYTFDLSKLGESNCDRCSVTYKEDTGIAKIVNTSTTSNINDGHYSSLTHKSTFFAKAGGTYKVSVNIASFSSKCIEGEKNIGFFIQSSALSQNPIPLGNVSTVGEDVIVDFSDKITADCDFTFRINFVCGESWQDKDPGYFSGEYVEISSLKFLTK